jgi:hypothetical protein
VMAKILLRQSTKRIELITLVGCRASLGQASKNWPI